jgi:beta-phosphoglucomutase
MTSDVERYGVIFDLDGVLVDTGEFHKQSWYELAEKEGFEMTDELFYETFGMQNYQIVPMLVERELSRAEIDQMSDFKEASYRKLAAGKLKLLPGVERLINDLKKSGFLLAVGTSAPEENLHFMLADKPVWPLFDAFTNGNEVTNGKPAPDTFLKAAEKLGLEPARCCVVEDAVPGVDAAIAAGMKVIAVTNTSNAEKLCRADMVVDSLESVYPVDIKRLISGK